MLALEMFEEMSVCSDCGFINIKINRLEYCARQAEAQVTCCYARCYLVWLGISHVCLPKPQPQADDEAIAKHLLACREGRPPNRSIVLSQDVFASTVRRY